MPPRQAIENAHHDLKFRWSEDHVREPRQTLYDVAPSYEVFRDAVVRANQQGYTSAASVTASILAGRWP